MRPVSEKIRWLLASERMWLAPKAQYSPQAWGIAPGFRIDKTPALKAQVNSSADETRVQRLCRCHLNSWGDAPGWYDKAPLALID
jgi:hypothetical protein